MTGSVHHHEGVAPAEVGDNGEVLRGVSVVILAREFPPAVGGLERQASLLARLARDAGAHVTVLTATEGAVSEPGISVLVRPRWLAPMPLYLLWAAAVLAVLRLWRRRSLVALATRVSAEAALLSLEGPVLGVPFVVLVLTGDAAGTEFRLQHRAWLRRSVARRAAAAVTHTEPALEELREAGFRGRLEAIPTLATPVAEEACRVTFGVRSPSVLWCGRDDPVKNLSALRRLFSQWLSGAGWSLAVVIDRPPSVPFPGADVHVGCRSPRTHLAAVDVLVLPSHFEGQSNAMAEAALEGTPTVAFATGGTPAALLALDGGEAVPLEAGERGLAEAVHRVHRRFRLASEREALRARARALYTEDAPRRWLRLLKEVSS